MATEQLIQDLQQKFAELKATISPPEPATLDHVHEDINRLGSNLDSKYYLLVSQVNQATEDAMLVIGFTGVMCFFFFMLLVAIVNKRISLMHNDLIGRLFLAQVRQDVQATRAAAP